MKVRFHASAGLLLQLRTTADLYTCFRAVRCRVRIQVLTSANHDSIIVNIINNS